MDDFDKRMALDVIEDALKVLSAPENRGFALGLCGGFYLCGLLSYAEWQAFLERIPKSPDRVSEPLAASNHSMH